MTGQADLDLLLGTVLQRSRGKLRDRLAALQPASGPVWMWHAVVESTAWMRCVYLAKVGS